jgi:hypothetical protein
VWFKHHRPNWSPSSHFGKHLLLIVHQFAHCSIFVFPFAYHPLEFASTPCCALGIESLELLCRHRLACQL